MAPELTTSRLRLRQWRDEDLAPFAELNADPVVMAHFPGVLTRGESDALAARIRQGLEAEPFGLWAVEVRLRGGPPFVGFVGLSWVPFLEAPAPSRSVGGLDAPFTPSVEIGWRLARAAWGLGYATEAARAALVHGFEEVGLTEVVSMTTPGNTRSRAVMERLGMRRDPADDFDHPRLPVGHPLRRHVLYRLRHGASRDPAVSARSEPR